MGFPDIQRVAMVAQATMENPQEDGMGWAAGTMRWQIKGQIHG
jgi:hypothetical protein